MYQTQRLLIKEMEYCGKNALKQAHRLRRFKDVNKKLRNGIRQGRGEARKSERFQMNSMLGYRLKPEANSPSYSFPRICVIPINSTRNNREAHSSRPISVPNSSLKNKTRQLHRIYQSSFFKMPSVTSNADIF